MRTIYGQSSWATADRSSAGAARARRLCAGLVVAGALFGSAAPAHADDGLALGGLDGNSVEATVAAVQTAAVAQASAIVNEAAQQAAPAPQAPPAPAPSTPQTGSASGVGSGISSNAQTPAQNEAQPAAPAPSAADPAQPATEPTVVAPTPTVVSQPDDVPTSPSAPAGTSPAPSGAFHKLAREYQQNPARYHALNSAPISHETVPVSTLESIRKMVPFTTNTSAQKPDSNPASNCAQDVPESESRTGCDAPPPHAGHAHVGAVANGAPPTRTDTTAQEAAAAPAPRLDPRSTVAGDDTQPLVVKKAIATAAPSRPATAAKPKHATPPSHSGGSSIGRGAAADRAGVGQTPSHADRPRSRHARIRTETAQRESASADRPVESAWPWLGLVLLLFGITSIGLAVTSVGGGGAAAVGGIAARVRTTTVSAAAIATRMRSKELSARADGGTADRPVTRGIRYRD